MCQINAATIIIVFGPHEELEMKPHEEVTSLIAFSTPTSNDW